MPVPWFYAAAIILLSSSIGDSPVEEAMGKIQALLDADRKWQEFLAEKESLDNRYSELEFQKMHFKAAEIMREKSGYSKGYFKEEQRKLSEKYGHLCRKYDEVFLEHNVLIASRMLSEVEIDEAVMLGGLEEGVAAKVRRIKREAEFLYARSISDCRDEYTLSR